MKTSVGELSKAELRLLLDLPDFGSRHVVDYYKPGLGLVRIGLAYWLDHNQLALTQKGLAVKCNINRTTPKPQEDKP